MGLLYAAFGVVALGGVDVTGWDLSWVWPVPIIAAGLLLLITARRTAPRGSSPPEGEGIEED